MAYLQTPKAAITSMTFVRHRALHCNTMAYRAAGLCCYSTYYCAAAGGMPYPFYFPVMRCDSLRHLLPPFTPRPNGVVCLRTDSYDAARACARSATHCPATCVFFSAGTPLLYLYHTTSLLLPLRTRTFTAHTTVPPAARHCTSYRTHARLPPYLAPVVAAHVLRKVTGYAHPAHVLVYHGRYSYCRHTTCRVPTAVYRYLDGLPHLPPTGCALAFPYWLQRTTYLALR